MYPSGAKARVVLASGGAAKEAAEKFVPAQEV